MRVAVVGGGISGLAAAYMLARDGGVEVTLYEKEDRLGGHSKTVAVAGIDIDIGFMVFNRVSYPNTMEMFEELGVEMETTDMSFAVSLNDGRGCEWGSRNGLAGLFAQRTNVVNPYFRRMIRDAIRFKDDALKYIEKLQTNPDMDRNEALGSFIKSHGYSKLFKDAYLVPICASIWSCSSEGVLNFSAFVVLSFLRNHYALQIFGRPQWLTVSGRSQSYVNKVRAFLEKNGFRIRTGHALKSVSLVDGDGNWERYDRCILAVHAPDALAMLGDHATHDEARVLGAFQYIHSDIYLHHDETFMPRNRSAWSSWNFLGNTDDRVCLTYWLNVVQNLGDTDQPYLVTFNPPHTPENTHLKWTTSHPFPSTAASVALHELERIQGTRGIWFCGAYQGCGFHEDGVKAGFVAAHGLLGKNCTLLSNRKHMVPSLGEKGARTVVTRFLEKFISRGQLTLLEEGGTIHVFGRCNEMCDRRSVIRVHNPSFYWKVATEADLGFADAYINGDFSLLDNREGLLDLFLIFIANREAKNSTRRITRRGWWTPPVLTASIASARYFFRHLSRQNTIMQARRNISRHYDLSNEFFSLFLDETMTYSCAIFQDELEELKVAQLRKIHLLIEKAKITKNHHILEIGCGWGSLAVEVVRRTGCEYTGITLSEEQLKYAERTDRIRLILCDYRQLRSNQRYDRIISCEMIEAVGHEYMEEFFRCCESHLAEDGLFVLQFSSIPDQRYDEFRRSPDFLKEYIFPGGNLPSLSSVTSAMAASSRFCVEHLENIGIHYYQTLIHWRNNFMANRSEIVALGFDETFIRTWEYYLIYCASGFKSRTLEDYQIVFSRPGNVETFSNNYAVFPTADMCTDRVLSEVDLH